VNDTQSVQGEPRLDVWTLMVCGAMSPARPPVAMMVASPTSARMRATTPSTCAANPYRTPDWIDSTVERPTTERGRTSSTERSAAACV